MSIRILRAGMLTTVQDSGRRGLRRHGVVQGGAMDPFALRCANLLAGNDEAAAGLECTIAGPELRIEEERVIVVAGFAPRATLDGRSITPWSSTRAAAGSVLSLHDTGHGCRAFIAFSGGIDVPPVLRSRATDLAAGFGGCAGRALRRDDVLPLGPRGAGAPAAGLHAGRSMLPRYSVAPVVRIMAAPETELLGEAGLAALESESYVVDADSNRMGCRLSGTPLSIDGGGAMISSPVSPGTVQLPPSGQPIVLLADAQTIGGYPRIAHVISADIPLVAQLRPGHSVSFRRVELPEAERLAARQRRDLRMLADALRLQGAR